MTSRRLLSPISKALLDAADYIEKHGHCKGIFQDKRGRVCMVGALMIVDNIALEISACVRLAHLIPFTTTIPDWNDEPERTADEVISILRQAALLEEP